MVVYDDGSPEPIRLFDHGVVYRDPETFGEYHLSYRTGDILSPKLDTYEPLGAELGAFAEAIRTGDRLVDETSLARDVVSLTEAADRSLREGGAEVLIERRRVFSRALAATDRARRELGQPLTVEHSSASGPDDADERRMQAVLLIGAADPPDGAIRALLEETLPYQRIVEAEHASAALVAADVESDHLSLVLVACDSEEIDAGEILAGLSAVCPQVPVLLWSNSLESRDIRDALDDGVRGRWSRRATAPASRRQLPRSPIREGRQTGCASPGMRAAAGSWWSLERRRSGRDPIPRQGRFPALASVKRSRDYVTRRALATSDALAITAAMAIALLLVTPSPQAGPDFAMSLLALPFWIALFKLYRLYDRDSKRVSHSTVDDVPWLFHALLVGALALWAYSKIAWPDRMQLAQGISFFVAALVGILFARASAAA